MNNRVNEMIDDLEFKRSKIADEYSRYKSREHPADFPVLPPMPVARYVDQEFFDLEMEKFWPKTWLVAGHADEIPNAGDYKLWEDLGLPIIIVRDKNSELRAFFNVCQHRGGAVVPAKCGNTRSFVCNYHCWKYGLNGDLLRVPDEHEFPGLDKKDYSLKSVAVQTWGNFIFLNPSNDAPALNEFLGPLTELEAQYKLCDRRVYETRTYEVPGNWKVGLDNNSEAYHVAGIHPQTVHRMLDHRGNVISLFDNGHSRIISPRREGSSFDLLDFDKDSHDPAYQLEREALSGVVIQPNINLTLGEQHFPLIGYWPDGPSKMKMVVYFTSPYSEEEENTEAAQAVVDGFAHALAEDQVAYGVVQKSYDSNLMTEAKLGYTERRIYHHHEYMDEVIGEENIPEHYRMKRVIDNQFNEESL